MWDLIFCAWLFQLFRDFHDNGDVTDSAGLSSRFDLLKSNFFCFLQIRQFIKSERPHFPKHPPESVIDSLLALGPGCSSIIFSFIDSLTRISPLIWDRRGEEKLVIQPLGSHSGPMPLLFMRNMGHYNATSCFVYTIQMPVWPKCTRIWMTAATVGWLRS